MNTICYLIDVEFHAFTTNMKSENSRLILILQKQAQQRQHYNQFKRRHLLDLPDSLSSDDFDVILDLHNSLRSDLVEFFMITTTQYTYFCTH